MNNVLKTGDVILVSKQEASFLEKLICKGIRWFTEFEYHHAAIICYREAKKELWVYEAVYNGFKPTYNLQDYFKRAENENIRTLILRKPENISEEQVIREVKDIEGSPYDFLSLLVWQPIDKLALKLFKRHFWLGPQGPKAKNKTYCTNAIARVFGFENWWSMTSKDLYLKLK